MDRDTRDRARQRPGEAERATPDPQGYMLIGREPESQRHMQRQGASAPRSGV